MPIFDNFLISVFSGSGPGLVPASGPGDQTLFLRGDGQWASGGGGGGGGYDLIQEEGINLTQQSTLNFVGAGLTAQNDGPNSRTNVTVNARLNDIAVLSPTLNSIIYGNGTNLVSKVPDIEQVLYVAKDGNDTTGNGSILFPYATVAGANAAITDNSISKRYLIFIQNGTYDEATPIALKPYVYYLGQGWGTRINSTSNNRITVDASFTGNGRSALMNLAVTGSTSLYFDFSGFGAASAVIDITNISINGGITFIGRTAGADFLQAISSYCLGNITYTNCQSFNLNVTSFGNVTLNNASGAGNAVVDLQACRCTDLTVASPNTGTVLLTASGTSLRGTVTVDGSSATLVSDAGSLPVSSTDVSVINGGTLTRSTGAYAVAYTPATPSDWSVQPTQVQQALDLLAQNSGSGTGLTWNIITTDTTASVNNGYVTNSASLVTVTLPATAAAGSVIRVAGYGSGGWQIAQNAGQQIRFGNISTTAGATGGLESSNENDAVELICVVADTDFIVVSTMGNITFN